MIYKPGHNIYAIYYFSVKAWFAKWNGTFFRSRIIQHLGWIRSDISYLSVFSLNAGNCVPEKLRIRTLFTELPCNLVSWIPENFDCVFIALQLASIRFCFFGFLLQFLIWCACLITIFSLTSHFSLHINGNFSSHYSQLSSFVSVMPFTVTLVSLVFSSK